MMKLRSVLCAQIFLMSLGICVAAAPNSQMQSTLHYKARAKSLTKMMVTYGSIPGELGRVPLFLFDKAARQPLYFRAMAGDESVRPEFKQLLAAHPKDYAAYLTYLTLGNRTITRQEFYQEDSVLSKALARAPRDPFLLTRMALLWANGDNITIIPGRYAVVLGSSPQAGAENMSHLFAVTRLALANSSQAARPLLVFELQDLDAMNKFPRAVEPCDQKLINTLVLRYGGRVIYDQYITALRQRYLGLPPALSAGKIPNVRALVAVLIRQQSQWDGLGEQVFISDEKKAGGHPLPVAFYKRATRFYGNWIAKLANKYHIDLKGTYYSFLNRD